MDYESQFKDYQEKKERYDRYIENQRKREAIENGEHKFWETQVSTYLLLSIVLLIVHLIELRCS